MTNIIKKEIEIDELLIRRLEIICDFCNATPTIINSSIRKIDKTNLNYIDSHKKEEHSILQVNVVSNLIDLILYQ